MGQSIGPCWEGSCCAIYLACKLADRHRSLAVQQIIAGSCSKHDLNFLYSGLALVVDGGSKLFILVTFKHSNLYDSANICLLCDGTNSFVKTKLYLHYKRPMPQYILHLLLRPG